MFAQELFRVYACVKYNVQIIIHIKGRGRRTNCPHYVHGDVDA